MTDFQLALEPNDYQKARRRFKPPTVPSANFSQHKILPCDFLEIGSGTGDFAISLAKSHPNKHVVGIERTHGKFAKFSDKLSRQPVHNLTALHANAVHVVPLAIKDGSLSAVYLLFPNPYPKKRQANKRFYTMPFMQCLVAKLKPGLGTITLASNYRDILFEAQSYLLQIFHLELLRLQTRLGGTVDARSAFERKYLARGDTVYEMVVRRPIV